MSLKDFQILSKIGQGSFAKVFKAQRIVDNKIYALKQIRINQLDAKSKQNALNQIRLLASFDCKNIIKYYEAFFEESENLLCIVMEFAEGGDLGQLIQTKKAKKQRFYEIQIWKTLISLIHGLDYLHQRSILHRDIKPQNIFICSQSHKIGDLNVSRIIQQNLQQKLTQIGTPFYASPQIWQNSPYDNKCDIWSLGCLIYQMATLQPPFISKSMDKLYQEITKEKVKPIPQHYSNQLANVIGRCLDKKAENRPTVKELLNNFTIKMYQNLYYSTEQLEIEKSKYQPLLKTITFPKNKNIKSVQLPNANYDKQQGKNNHQINNISGNYKNSINDSKIQKKQAINDIIAAEQKVLFQQSCDLQSEPASVRTIKQQKVIQNNQNNNNNNLNNKPIIASVINELKQQIKQAKQELKKQPSIKKLMLQQPIFNRNDNKVKNSVSKYRHYSEMGQQSNAKRIIDEFRGSDKSKRKNYIQVCNIQKKKIDNGIKQRMENLNPEQKISEDSQSKNRKRSLPRTQLSAKKIQVCTQMDQHKNLSAQKLNLMQQNNNYIDDYKKVLLSKLPQNMITSLSGHKPKKSIIQQLVSHQKSRENIINHQIQAKNSNINQQNHEMVRKRSKIFISSELQNIFDQSDHNKNNYNQRCHQKGRIASVPSMGKII